MEWFHVCQEVLSLLQAANWWDVTKQGVSPLFHLFGSFHSGTYISPGGAIPSNKYKLSTYVGLRHPVIARYAFRFESSMFAYVDLAHTGASYSVIEWHRARAVVFKVFAFVPYFELATFLKRLLRVATFILAFCMCCL